jgi:hypothetical protein
MISGPYRNQRLQLVPHILRRNKQLELVLVWHAFQLTSSHLSSLCRSSYPAFFLSVAEARLLFLCGRNLRRIPSNSDD